MSKRDKMIEKIVGITNKDYPDAEIFLYGSQARGDAKSYSDWDLLILIDEQLITNEIEDKFRDELYDIELETGQIISTFIYPKNYWENTLFYSPLYKNVLNEGIQL